MIALTISETRSFLSENESGWNVSDNGLPEPESSTAVQVRFEIPEVRNSLRAFIEDCTFVLDDRFNRPGYLLWFTGWYLGTEEYAQVGWTCCELMRRGYAELRSLEAAPAQRFRSDEDRACQAFLLQAMLHQWDALLIPDLQQYLVGISEAELTFYLPDREIGELVASRMSRWDPQPRV